jgi:hypothetical protein
MPDSTLNWWSRVLAGTARGGGGDLVPLVTSHEREAVTDGGFILSKTILYEKLIQRCPIYSKTVAFSFSTTILDFLISLLVFLMFHTSIENLIPKRELQPLRIVGGRFKTSQ